MHALHDRHELQKDLPQMGIYHEHRHSSCAGNKKEGPLESIATVLA